MQLSQFLTRPRAVFGLAFFGFLPLAWQASGVTPKHAAPHTILRAETAPRPHGALRPHGSATGGPPTAVPFATFPGKPDGALALSRLIQAGDGNFYGVTQRGGSADAGTAFRMTPDGAVTTLDSFGRLDQSGSGRIPGGPLVEGMNADGTPDGVFFGTTLEGGDSFFGNGSIYMLAPDAGRATKYAITYLYAFTGGADGGSPPGGLTIGRKADGTPDGYLYGTTTGGGRSTDAPNKEGSGVVFRMTTNGFVESVLHAFPRVDTANVNQGGSAPRAGLFQVHDASGWGKFFGTTSSGGSDGQGTVFSVTSAGDLVTLHDFLQTPDGQFPLTGLTQGADGALYGTTLFGGAQGAGTVYRLVTDAKSSTGFTYLQSVSLDSDNKGPLDSLIQASDGKLYGTASAGGGGGLGSVFRVDADSASPTGFSATQIFTFTDQVTQGSDLSAGLTQGTDGDFYGITTQGGSSNVGTIYRLNVVPPKKAPAPTITSVIYHHYDSDGSTNVSVTGTGIAHGATLTISDFFGGTGGTVLVDDAAHIHADLTKALPPGVHQITIANADGQSASTTLTAYGKPRIDGVVAITHKDGKVSLLVSGTNFPPNGYNGSDFGLLPGVFDPISGNLEVPAVSGRSDQPGGAAPETPQQFVLDLGTIPSGILLVGVLSADGQYSGVQPVGTPGAQARKGGRAKGHATAAGTQAIIYSKGRTQYQVFFSPTIIYTGDIIGDIVRYIQALVKALIFQLFPSANASPTQLLAGSVSLVHDNPASVFSTTGPTTVLAGLISQDGGGLISQDGGSLISQDGGGLISQDGGGLISQDGGGVISNDGGSLIGKDGGSVISNDGGSVISNDGGSLVATGGGNFGYTKGVGASLKSSIIGHAAAGARRPAIVHAVLGAIGSGPGVGGKLRILNASVQAKAVKSHAATDTPGSFTLTQTNQGPENGVGSTDAVVTGDDGAGHEITLLRITFTPGQPDTLAYVAPGVVVKPTEGTPAPKVSSPAPTLTALSPNTALAGSPDLTLAVTGTLFEDGTVVVWNGKPLATTILSGTQATATVPAALLSAQGTVKVTLTNPAPGGGPSAPLPFVVAPAAATLHTFPAGLQMLAVTEDYANVGLSAALSDSSHALLVWNPATAVYETRTDLHPGTAYWTRLSKPTDLLDTGTPAPTSGPFSIALRAGWNMIGDPFPTAVALSDIQVRDAIGTKGTFGQAVSGGVVSGTLYAYPAGSTQYQKVGQDGNLTPFDGDWIYAFRACTLLVPAH